MRKAKLLLFVILSCCILPLHAQIKYFAGVHGDFSFPAFQNGEQVYGFGGGGTIEGGVYLGNLSLGLLAGLSFSNDKGELVYEMTEWKAGVEAGYDFGKDIIPFFPEWLAVRPNLAVLADFYKSDGYRSKSKKTIGKDEVSQGFSPVIEAGLLVDFPNLLTYKAFDFIPTVGYYETFRMENEGMLFSGRISLGMRVLFSPEKLGGFNTEGGTLNVFATTRSKMFTPNGDGEDDIVVFDVSSDADEHEGVNSWEVRFYDPGQKIFFIDKGKGELPQNYTWKGLSQNGTIVDGGAIYQYVWYVKANDGSDGFIPGIIQTGVMLQEDDGVLHFSLSSIQFGPNSAGYEGLTDEEIQRNKDLFDTVAKILQKYANYNVTIEGHANNVSGTEREHLKELLPLSAARAQTVKKELIARGIEAERLNAVGRGSEKMVTTKKDEAWKNRRVEFILTEKE